MRRFLPLAAVLLLLRCAGDGGVATVTGNGDASEAGNAFVSGKVVTPLGEPVPGVEVALYPAEYDPVGDSAAVSVAADTADSAGRYRLPVAVSGTYNVLARSADRLYGVIIDSVAGDADDSVGVRDDSLRRVGCSRVLLDSMTVAADGYLYLPGTDVSVRLDSVTVAVGTVMLHGLPAGSGLRVWYRGADGSGMLIYEHLQVIPGDTTHCPGPQCKRWSLAR